MTKRSSGNATSTNVKLSQSRQAKQRQPVTTKTERHPMTAATNVQDMYTMFMTGP